MNYRSLSLTLLLLSTAAFAQEPPAPAAAVSTPATAAEATKATSKAAPPNTKAAKAAKAPAEQPARKAGPDRLDLDKTVVTGNRELPKVLYIVPWKKSDIGDLPAQPFNTLLDEALAPVDRDVFKRELRYYDALQGEGQKTAAPASQGEK